jgi:hypothetical protein
VKRPGGVGLSEVSAVVLSVGEPYTVRAINSLGGQSVPLHERIVIEHVSPFSGAINEGARRVTTPYFVQVDADMILDPTCVEVLLRHMQPGTGIVVGELRDAIVGQVVGIRMFRTACFRDGGMPDSISPDTDFGVRLTRQGWRTQYVENPGAVAGVERPTVGEHRPDYTPSYTHRKFLLEGARIRYRAARHGLMFQLDALDHSTHPLALLAQVAYAHGLFLPMERDELKAPQHDRAADALAAFLGGPGRADPLAADVLPITRQERPGQIFRRFVAVGAALADAGAGATFREAFASLSGTRADRRALAARIGLAHGLLMARHDRTRVLQDERALRDFLVFNLGSRATAWDRVRARTRVALAAGGERATEPW